MFLLYIYIYIYIYIYYVRAGTMPQETAPGDTVYRYIDTYTIQRPVD